MIRPALSRPRGYALFALLVALYSTRTGAELRCDPPGNPLYWPEERPVWELCWFHPSDSSGLAGSGLELRNVRFRGVLVLAQAQVPVVWAELGGEAPGCDRCFRTWAHQESPFGARGEVVPGYYELELNGPPGLGDGSRTICDRPPGAAPGECPWGDASACGTGVAVERWEDGFRLTTQLAAGWFRYSQRWTFHRDGTIEPRFGFARSSNACAEAPSLDTAVWRLDLDIGAPGNRYEPLSLPNGEEPAGWQVTALRSDIGYRLTAGDEDIDPRWLLTLYDPNTFTDPGRSCAFDPEQLAPRSAPRTAEADPPEGTPAPAEDPVIWYIASAADVAEAGCREVGPTLAPVGPWRSPPGDNIFLDGFESGGLDAWVTSDQAIAAGDR